MAEFYPIKREEMASFLESQGFRLMSLPNVTELIWGKRVDRDGQSLSLRVYSGINPSGDSRGKGQDAIRVEVYWRDGDGTICRIGGSKRVHRVRGWRDNLQNRIDQWEDGLGPVCPECGAPMRLREPKKGQTWTPFYGCVRWKPNNAGCNGVARIPRPAGRPTALPTREERAQFKQRKQRKSRSKSSPPKSPSPPAEREEKGELPWDRDDRLWRESQRS
jgi:hypothetical protein